MADESHLQKTIQDYLKRTKRSARNLSLAVGTNDSLVKSILRGNSEMPRPDTLKKLAAEMGMTVSDLTGQIEVSTLQPNVAPALDAPIVSVPSLPKNVEVRGIAVGGNDGDFRFNGDVIEHVARPPAVSTLKQLAAIYVVGTSMYPWRQKGDLVYFTDLRPARAGDHVIVEMHPKRPGEPGPAYLKKLVAQTPTKIRLEQYNPPDDQIEFKLADVLRIYRVFEWPELIGL